MYSSGSETGVRNPFGVRETMFSGTAKHIQKKNQNNAPKEKKFLNKIFQTTYLFKPNLTNTICYKTLQAT